MKGHKQKSRTSVQCLTAAQDSHFHRQNIANMPTVDFLPTPSNVGAKYSAQLTTCLVNK